MLDATTVIAGGIIYVCLELFYLFLCVHIKFMCFIIRVIYGRTTLSNFRVGFWAIVLNVLEIP